MSRTRGTSTEVARVIFVSTFCRDLVKPSLNGYRSNASAILIVALVNRAPLYTPLKPLLWSSLNPLELLLASDYHATSDFAF